MGEHIEKNEEITMEDSNKFAGHPMEIKNILVPIGGSDYSHNALELAVRFAKKSDSLLTGLYVKDIRFFEGPWFKSIRGSVISDPYFELKKSVDFSLNIREKKIKSFFEYVCDKAGVRHKFGAHKGIPSRIILSRAEDSDLVIMGKRGEHARWLQKLLGSECYRVLHDIDRPLVVVDQILPKEVKRVLLCFAGGYFADKALEMTRYFHEKNGFKLSVLTIATETTKAIQVQRRAKDYFLSHSIKAQYLLSTGDVEKEIIKVKDVWAIDMIITGGSLYKKYEDYISFSLADRILSNSTIPVLFVR
jgi:nucleotide-binding universal stress UspA family protein